MLQSPLMPRIALLISAGAKARMEGKDPARCLKTMAMRGNVLMLVKDLVGREMGNFYAVAIHAVVHLVHLDVRIPNRWSTGETLR